jgi:hypothetical protein
VGVLQRFERRLEGLVEGAFARVFRGEVHPTEIAAALQREADDRKAIISGNRVLVPNEYVVELSPHDHDRLAPYADPLSSELAELVQEHADEEAYSFPGPVRIRFELASDLDTGMFRVRSDVVPQAEASGGRLVVPQPGADAPMSLDGALPGNPRLLLNPSEVGIASPESRGRQHVFPLLDRTVTLGRSPDCDLQLTDPGVSRRHARLRYLGETFIIEDLASTNGTLVNNMPVGERQLAPGDRIRLGSTTLVYQRDETG